MRRLLLVLLGLVVSGTAGAETVTVKIATLAPRGSTWAKITDKTSREVFKKTDGRVRFKYYYAGAQGDERDVVRKMKLGQLDGAALTAVGLGLIDSDVRVLELPFLFRSVEELDKVRDRVAPDFEKRFEKEGFVLLAWGDVGWVHSYSQTPVKSLDELRKLKMWVWPDDPIQRAMVDELGLSGVPMGVPQVLPALQTGQIQVVHGPPLACVALQWYTKVRYATDTPTAYAVGAVVLRKETWDKISPADRDIILEGARVQRDRLKGLVRRDNERSKEAMKKAGIKFEKVPKEYLDQMMAAAKKIRTRLAGKVYSRETLALVDQLLADMRK